MSSGDRADIQLKKRALYDIWAFADLIKFKGGVGSFDPFHFEMTEHYVDALDQTLLQKLMDQPELWAEYASTFVNIVARGYLKSTVNTILNTLWRIYRNPDIRINISTNNQFLAYSFIRELRSYFEDTDLMARVWDSRPHIPGRMIPNLKVTKFARGASADETDAADQKIIWNNVSLQVLRSIKAKEPTVSIGSANSINTGNHYDLVIFDDVVDFDNSNTQVKRVKIKRWVNEVESQLDPLQVVRVQGTTFPLLDAIGQKIINGTLYYDEDLYSGFIDRSDVSNRVSVHLRNIYKNGVDDKDGYNWGSRFNSATVADIRERIDDPAVFAAQYENRTLQQYRADTNDVRHFINCDNNVIINPKTVEITYEGNTYSVELFAAMDVAAKHDYSILLVGAYILPGVFVCVDSVTNRGSLDKFLRECYHMVQNRYPVRMCYVEANGVGGGCKTALGMLHQQLGNGEPLKFTEIWQTESKAIRIAYALQFMSDNEVVYMGAIHPRSEFVRQIKSYPSEYDDAIDCLSTCLYRFPKQFQKQGQTNYRKTEVDNSRNVNAKLRKLYVQSLKESNNTISLRNKYANFRR